MTQTDLYAGRTLRVRMLDNDLLELAFDRQGEAINKLDRGTIQELSEAVVAIQSQSQARGVLMTSAKDVFIVGADITEFGELFRLSNDDLAAYFMQVNEVFERVESLTVPVVVAINGFALGGGLEMALTGDYRVISSAAQIGLPEVTLGLFPGFGGTVRLPRVANPQTAIEWISSGKPNKAQVALAAGVVDEIATPEALRASALQMLGKAAAGELDWKARRKNKEGAVQIAKDACATLFAAAKIEVARTSAKNQPAALAAVELMAESILVNRHRALELEAETFARIAKTQAAGSLVQAFLSDQAIKKKIKAHTKAARPVKHGAVLGAGIMGGGIAYTSAIRGTPVRMKDIAQAQLELGTSEAKKQLSKQVKSGRLAQEKADAVLTSITPQLDYAGFKEVDVVIEAVVENIKIKHAVLTEVERVVGPAAVIASNTSSLRINDLAQPLLRPENFVGMHFFNPVPVMPLVEIIKGDKTSEAAVSTAVSYAVAMGKTPIVVKDCPGFLVNRILTAYMRGFLQLLTDGADFVRVDAVMENFGWPMGPAYLEDVIGMDTGSHVNDIISAGYPERMPALKNDALRLMMEHRRFGQKNGLGFYRYEPDPMGKPKKLLAPDTHGLLTSIQLNGARDFSDAEIIERMMLPMIIEAVHALEEKIVATPAELDTALVLGLGFPRYAGGPLKYADWLGLKQVVALADKYATLGKQYEVTKTMRVMASNNDEFYGSH